MKFLLIGEAPARDVYKKRLEFALACAAAGKPPTLESARSILREYPMLGDFWGRCDSCNLLGAWPGRSASGRGSAFPFAAAYQRADEMQLHTLHERLGYAAVLLCGTRVARAFGFGCATFYEAVAGFAPTFVVPHPSRASGHWNDPTHAVDLRLFLLRLIGASRTRSITIANELAGGEARLDADAERQC